MVCSLIEDLVSVKPNRIPVTWEWWVSGSLSEVQEVKAHDILTHAELLHLLLQPGHNCFLRIYWTIRRIYWSIQFSCLYFAVVTIREKPEFLSWTLEIKGSRWELDLTPVTCTLITSDKSFTYWCFTIMWQIIPTLSD